jgi:GNAT superfamily N-acetyltransferase
MNLETSVVIRQATAMDVSALHSLIELSVRGLQKDDYTPAQIEGALGHALGLDTQLIEDRTYFVAEASEQGGMIVACGGWSNRRTLFGSDRGPNRENAFLDPKTDAAKIRAIFVHPQWARKGLGTLILEHCEAAAQRAGFGTVEMGSTLTGVALYTLKGYVPLEQVAVPLPNGETLAVVHMVKRFISPHQSSPFCP